MPTIEETLEGLSGGGGGVNLLGLTPEQINNISKTRIAGDTRALGIANFLQSTQQNRATSRLAQSKFDAQELQNQIANALSQRRVETGEGNLEQSIKEADALEKSKAATLKVSKGRAKTARDTETRKQGIQDAIDSAIKGFPERLQRILTIDPDAASKLIETPAKLTPPQFTRDVQLRKFEDRIIDSPSDERNQADIPVFNKHTDGNTMYYWQTVPGTLFGTNSKAKSINLESIEKGLTPAKIRAKAKSIGVTVEALLQHLDQ